MIGIGGGFMADTIPCTIQDIQNRIERNAEESFILSNVPELLFWELGLEYIGTDTAR